MILDKILQDSLIKYCKAQISEQRIQRMAVARQVGLLRSYVKGEPADWFDPSSWRYRSFADAPNYNPEDVPRYNFHINISNAAWQVLQAAIQTVGIPGSTFIPVNRASMADQDTADLAKTIIDFQHASIPFRAKWMQTFRFLYTDGLALAYTHFVRDESKHGTSRTQVQKRVEVPLAAGYACTNCQQFTPPQGIGQVDGKPSCPQCGTPYGSDSYMKEETQTEMQTSLATIPAGRSEIDMFGALETVLPWWAPDLTKAPYAAIRVEVPPEMVLQAFPGIEESLAMTGDGTEDFMLKLARERSKAPKDSTYYPMFRFPTYGRWWLRPETFFRETDKGIRTALLNAFPNGCFLQEINMQFCDAIPEKMEDHLELIKAFESDGMYCPSIGQNGVPIQQAVNTAFNLEIEGMEFAAFPPVLIDSELLNGVALKNSKARPGEYKEIALPAGKDLRNSVFQIVIKESATSVNRILDSYQQFMEYLVGISQALLGGAVTNTRSSEQYNTQRAQSLQRQAPPYEAAKVGFAGIDEDLVNDALANWTPEEFALVVGASAANRGDVAYRLASDRGRVYAYPEESEAIPQTHAQRMASIDQLETSQNPMIQAWVADPLNLQEISNAKALGDGWHVAGLDQIKNVRRTIDELMKSAPTPGPAQLDHQSGQMVPGPPSATIQFDPDFDDPQITVNVIKEWASTPEGNQARKNPNIENVRLYKQQAEKLLQPPPKPPITKPTLAEDAGNALVSALASPNIDKAGVIAEKTLEGLGVLTPKAASSSVQ